MTKNLIILLNGNSVSAPINSKDVDKTSDLITDAITSSKKLNMSDGEHVLQVGNICIVSKNIQGWYFKDPEGPTVQDLTKKFLESQLNPPGEDWKG